MKNLSRNVTLYCDVCGNDQFSTIDDLDLQLQRYGEREEDISFQQ